MMVSIKKHVDEDCLLPFLLLSAMTWGQSGKQSSPHLKAADTSDTSTPESETEKPLFTAQIKPNNLEGCIFHPEQLPVFTGGPKALKKFTAQHLRYPIYPDLDYRPAVVVAFIVQKDGSLSHMEVKRSLNKELDSIAVAFIKKMPHWQPGRHMGEAIQWPYIFPVVFEDERTRQRK